MPIKGPLGNLPPLKPLEWNPYTEAFHAARRLRRCPNGCTDGSGAVYEWSFIKMSGQEHSGRLDCPRCGQKGYRVFRRFLLRAGRRGGKTRSSAQAGYEEASIPDTVGWMCAPTFPELNDYVIPAFFSHLPRAILDHDQTYWNVENKELTLPNRSKIQFRSLDDPDRGRGQGLDWLALGEAAKMSDKVWDIIRPSLSERRGIAFLDTTPRGEENWTHQRFWEPAASGVPGFWAIEYTTADNPTIPPEEIEEARKTMPPKMFQQEYLAENVVFEGAIFGDKVDIVEADDAKIKEWIPEWPAVDPRRPCVVALDPGTDHPFAGVKLVGTPKGIVAVGEYEERQKSYREHVIGIKALVGASKPRYGRDRSQAQAGIELGLLGIYTESVENKVLPGIERVYSWMESGQFLIARSRCPRLLKELRAYKWAPNTRKDGQETEPQPFKKFDDLCLAGGTQITTREGAIPIEAIELGMDVWTRAGWRRVDGVRQTGWNIPVLRLTTSDGRTLIGTAQHPVWTLDRGFVPLDSLRYGDILATCPDAAYLSKLSSSTDLHSGGTLARHGWRIGAISHRMWKAYVEAQKRRITENSGDSITGQFQQAITFIMSMATGITTRLRTWRASKVARTNGITWRFARKWHLLRRLSPLPLRGTSLQPAVAGIGSTGATRGSLDSPWSVSARSAAAPIKTSPEWPGSAQTPVNLHGAAQRVWTMSSAFVRSALHPFKRTNTATSDAVLVSVVSVSDAGRADVYNLDVDGVHEYFANGILTHNCDALRYALMMWPTKPKVGTLSDDGITAARDISLLSPKVRDDIERASAGSGVTEDGLIRVTDQDLDIMPAIETALDDPIAEFYR